MINDFTQYHSLPLPHPNNQLDDDVLRLRDALSAIDNKLHSLDVLLSSDDVTLDQVQELVSAIKANRTDIVSLLAGKANKSEVDAALLLKASIAQVTAGLAPKADKTELPAEVRLVPVLQPSDGGSLVEVNLAGDGLALVKRNAEYLSYLNLSA